MAYIPSRRVLAEGGYEGASAMVYYGLPSPWAPSVEESIVGAVVRWPPRNNLRLPAKLPLCFGIVLAADTMRPIECNRSRRSRGVARL